MYWLPFCSWVQACTRKSYMTPFSFSFLCHVCRTTICGDPEIVPPLQRDVTPFPLYCSGSRSPSRVQRAYMQPNLVLFRVITRVLPFTAVSCLQLVAIMMKVVHALSRVATDYSRRTLLTKSTEPNKLRPRWPRGQMKKKKRNLRLSFSLHSLLWYQYIVPGALHCSFTNFLKVYYNLLQKV